MATALLLTFTWREDSHVSDAACNQVTHYRPAMTSQTINFIDRPQAEKALAQIIDDYKETSTHVIGTILKDVII